MFSFYRNNIQTQGNYILKVLLRKVFIQDWWIRRALFMLARGKVWRSISPQKRHYLQIATVALQKNLS